MRVNAIAFAEMMRILVYKHATALELSQETGLTYQTVLIYLRHLYNRKVIVVSSWKRMGTGWARVWSIRSAFCIEDAPRPKKKPNAQVCLEYRRRKQSEGSRTMI